MRMNGYKIFTGGVQLLEGWEIRPFAIQKPGGSFTPGLSARRHKTGGETGTVYAFDSQCPDKEAAFDLALSKGRSLVCTGFASV